MLPKNLAVCNKIIDEIGIAESFVAGVDFEAFDSDEMLSAILGAEVEKHAYDPPT